jgi:hypothetical protein
MQFDCVDYRLYSRFQRLTRLPISFSKSSSQHAKRLFPLQISTKAQVEWGYRNEENAWVAVDKSVLDSVQEAGIEKSMGFEGTPDPTTGFYCVRS